MSNMVRNQTNWKAKDQVRVGFYGCWKLDRVIRVGMADGEARHPQAFPKAAEVQCPCGEGHEVGLVWRPLNENELLDAEVLL